MIDYLMTGVLFAVVAGIAYFFAPFLPDSAGGADDLFDGFDL